MVDLIQFKLRNCECGFNYNQSVFFFSSTCAYTLHIAATPQKQTQKRF